MKTPAVVQRVGMNSLTIVLFIIIGLVLVYASVKNKDPKQMIKDAVSRNA